MSRRGAGIARGLPPPEADATAPDAAIDHARNLQLIETPTLGAVVGDTVRALIRAGMRPPEVASLMTSAAVQLAQQGKSRLSRAEWLTLCAVLWDGPGVEELVSAPGGDA